MSKLSAEKLDELLSNVPEKLDFALSQKPMQEYLLYRRVIPENTPANMLRRSPLCQFTNQILAQHLESNEVPAMLYMKNGQKTTVEHRGRHYPATHIISRVALIDGYRFIDPTTEQFYGLSGLTTELVREYPEVAGLYPDGRVSDIHDIHEDFGREFAINAHAIEQQLLSAGYEIGQTDKEILVGTTLEEKISFYGQIWDTKTYNSYRHSSNRDLRSALVHAVSAIDFYDSTKH